MNERDAWLDLTREVALEPDLPICDPHHHLWDYAGSRYLIDEFLHDLTGGHRVVSSVFVECLQFYRSDGPEHLKPVGETEFVHQITQPAQDSPTAIAAGIVAFANLAMGAPAAEVLQAHMEASPRMRGIRHATAWHAGDGIHNAHTRPPEGLMGDKRFREGFTCLEPLGLTFDAWLYHTQLPELLDLARAFPGINIVLDHMAGPLGIGPYRDKRQEAFNRWREGLEPLAHCDNVHVKLGGRAMTNAGFGWHKYEAPPGSAELAEAMTPYFDACIDLFGPGRCMFESNFPVDRASCSYTVLWNAFKRASERYSPPERAALMHDTAVAFYRLPL